MQKKWVKVTTRKTTKSEAKKLYNELIQKDNDLVKEKKLMKVMKLIALENIIS